jgi:hypothetical protein
MPTNRTAGAPAIFAAGATTTIPDSPTPGVVYRNPSADGNAGWGFSTIVASEKFNQYLFELAAVVKAVDQWGILPWCATTAYLTSALVMGTDANIYQALAGSTNQDPTTSPTYWQNWIETIVPPWSTTVDGVGRLATDAEAIAGTVSTAAITPESMAAAFVNSKAANGYQKLPGGIILQWATGVNVSTEINQTITFPIAFPTACLSLQVSTYTTTYGTGTNGMYQITAPWTKTAAIVGRQWFVGSNDPSQVLIPVIFAVGY